MEGRLRKSSVATLTLGWLTLPCAALAFPAPGPLEFIGPTPASGEVTTQATINVRLSASCTVDAGTLSVTLEGVSIPTASFLPFSPCSDGRTLSQIATATLGLPNGTITSGPNGIDAGGTATFTGAGSGDGLRWNFDGGAEPAEGVSVSPVFEPAGQFTVRLRATDSATLQASALDGGSLVTDEVVFDAGDPTPDSHALSVMMPPDTDFRNFESSQVHPVVVSETSDQLFAVNTPEGRLAIFDIAPDGSLALAHDVPVGLDPVSLAQRPGTDEVWVANHVSDSVSVVDASSGKLLATLDVGDEPTDILFASGRAFVSLSGQLDRVMVYDAATRVEIAALDIFGDDPRALAANAAGTEVYLVVLESGNRTTTLFRDLVESGGGPPPPSPPRSPGLGTAPVVSLIVQFDPATGRWEDETGDDWSAFIDYTIPDQDLFIIDADAATPSVVGTVSDVGTLLFDVAVRPGTGELYVPNTDARNLVRYESNLRGHLLETRLSVVDTTAPSVSSIDLNPHINYAVSPGPPGEIAQSLAQPGDGVFSSDGSTLYLTAFGSRKVGVFDATTGSVVDRIDVGGGPSGVALNENAGLLYVLNRFENTISLVDTVANVQIEVIGLAGSSGFDPSPDMIKVGRKFLYDAQLTSGHGDIACASCHPFGNFDNLAWDLGDPQGEFVSYNDAPWVSFFFTGPSTSGFDPMKGPMTTQTLRGLQDLEPLHWRGDRPDFQAFNPAFVALMGRANELSAADMDAYTGFIQAMRFMPNPYRNLDDSLPAAISVPLQSGSGLVPASPGNGSSDFVNQPFAGGVFTCNQCHALPTGTNNQLFNGNLEGETQDFKIPHLRNMYEKLGFRVVRPGVTSGNPSNIGASAQKAGYGFLHDGGVSLTEFMAASVFNMDSTQERNMFAFMMAFPTETKPAVGAQITVDLSNKNDAGVIGTISTLIDQAELGNCDVIAKGVIGGVAKGWVYDSVTNAFVPDSLMEGSLAEAALRASVLTGDVLTYTGVPAGAGKRLGIDRDRDGWLNRTEAVVGTDPANPNSNLWQWSN